MKLLLLHIAYLFLCCFVTFTNPSATGEVSINCGSIGTSAARDGHEWVGDGDVINHKPKSPPCSLRGSSSSTASTVNQRDSVSADPVPHGTARISRSQFSYAFEVGPGQKLIRLHFHSAPYRGFIGLRDLFTVEAGPFTVLSNFSASLAAYVLGANSFSKDFCLSVQENQLLNITFSPEASSSKSLETYAFVNGIEIISVPAGLSYIQGGGEIEVQVLGQKSQVFVDHHTALELIHRQNTKQAFLMTGAYLDELGKAESVNNETWRIPVDAGFRYMIRLHLSGTGDVVFRVLINEMIALTNLDIVEEKRVGNKILWYKDCVVLMMRGHKMEGRRDLLISLQSYDETIDGHGFLAGFEVFKLSNPDNSLASPNPLQSKSVGVLFSFLGRRNAVSFVVVTIISLVCIIVHTSRGYWEANCRKEENKPSERAERLCRRFSLAEIHLATRDFSEGLLIGRGGFGKVYKGFIDRGQTTVAVKRLKSNSMQGAHEFLMEIETLSELRHFNLVSLIGYCNEQREMILVYDFMSGGTLSDCLYKLQCENNDSSSLTWKQRLNICIGAGRGLDYLHTGHGVIHRDVKTSNILLDENLVAKVSDFGLAKHEDRGKKQSHISTRVKGTRGYLDPHYLHTRKLTRKTDTYAFGVVLFEVLCGRRAVDLSLVDDEHILTVWAREKISKGEVDEIVDLSLRGEISLASLKTFVGIAEKCLRDEPKNRPTMAQVVQQLDFALGQQDNEQVLVSNEITSASDDTHPSNEDFDVSRNSEQPTMAFTHEQGLTPLLEEQANSQLVNTGLSRKRRDGRKYTMRKPSRLWPWDAFWSRVKPSKKNDLSSETNARIAEIWDETSIRSTMFDWDMIAASTNQFSIDHQLGQSRFSSVYKGVLPTGQEVAVKRRSSSSKHGFQKYKNETHLLPNLLHQNIIKLLGYCIRGDKLLTVYEFIGNQSLDTFITGQQHFLLQWDVRFKIIMGIARGVAYLHQDSVIHQNLKPSNILMDHEMNPKIINFGTARTGTNQACWSPTPSSKGYIPPESVALGKFSVKSEVYSFGVIILEIVSGQRSIRPSGSEPMLLTDYASELWYEDRGGDLVDESLGGAFPQEEALRFIHVGLLCTQREPNNRPTMPSVLKMLEGNELLVELQQISFFGKLLRKHAKLGENLDGGSSAVSSTSKSSTATGSRAGNSSGGVPHSVIHSAQKTSVQDPLNPKSNESSGPDSFVALPSFRDVPNSEKQNLFVRKLNLCCVLFDFTDPLQNLKGKEIKRQTLLELVDYINSANGKFSEIVVQEIVIMVSANLFRTQFTQRSENKAVDGFDLEEEEPLLDPTWPHLQLVYEILLRFVTSPETEPKLAKHHLDNFFVLRLLDLFDSEDPREREYLKTVLHRIYGKFMVYRPFIRKSLNNIFYHFIFETEKHSGIAELLEIMGSIINGFSLPLKEEHELFFARVLIPLHRPKCLPMYHQQLSYCITQFLEKDCKLSGTIIRGLLKYWPITNSSKEVMFLGELEEVLEATHPPEFQRCMVPLFRQISRCLSSSHFQVAERALFLWNNERVEKMIKQNRKTILPIILPALDRYSRSHWNQAVRSLTLKVREIFSNADPELFEECLLKFQDDEAHEEEIKKKREAMWRRMEEIAACNEAVVVSRKGGPSG